MNVINTIKRFSATILATLSLTVVLLGIISAAAAILAIVVTPFVGAAMAVNFMEQTKGSV
jgi:hypothetical protein